MYQVSTLNALLLGYFRGVITVEELLSHGDIGLGTFQDVNGEMIVLDHKVYRADHEGNTTEMKPDDPVSFAAVAYIEDGVSFDIKAGNSIDDLKQQLDIVIDEDFGLNSMYAVRIDGHFSMVKARSEKGKHTNHIKLKEILKENQQDFSIQDTDGSLVCLYFPDYMHGINAAGWHFHFISDDRKKGGHVYDLAFDDLKAQRKQLHNIQLQLPTDKAYDTYNLLSVTNNDVKEVEQ